MLTTGVTPWPATLAGSPAVATIERAIARQRFSHSVLLHGDNAEELLEVAYAIADRLLHPDATASHHPIRHHADCQVLRPVGKSRTITAENTRELIDSLQMTGGIAAQKAAIIFEADRMHPTSANIFLKTLEEPPANTTILLVTARPYSLLPTIRSRVLHFRFPSSTTPLALPGWEAWLQDYAAWIEALRRGDSAAPTAPAVTQAYGLVARFGAVLDAATEELWKREKATLPATLDDDEEAAIQTGLANGLRTRLFFEVEQATRLAVLPPLRAGDEAARRGLTAAVGRLERAAGLLRVNLNELAVLENFLLASLPLWRPAAPAA